MSWYIIFYRYKVRLELPADHDEDIVSPETDVNSVLGTERGFYRILQHYEQEFARCGSASALVRQAWPGVAPGMVCAALHGIIHTGYHLVSNVDHGVREGLAVSHYYYKPLVYNKEAPGNQLAEFGKGTRSALSIIEEIRNDKAVHDKMVTDSENLRAAAKRKIGTAGFRMASMCGDQGDRLVGLVNQLQVPDFKQNPAKVLGDFLVQTALVVYHGSARRNDFFLLHGVTGAWSLRHIMDHLSEEDMIDSARIFLCCLLATYVTQDSPNLEHAVPACDVTDQTWKEIIDKAFGFDYDEHIYKLVQVCHDMWKENPTSPHGPLYVASARVALSEKLSHAGYIEIDRALRKKQNEHLY